VGGTVTEGVATARQKYRPAGLTASRENGTLKNYRCKHFNLSLNRPVLNRPVTVIRPSAQGKKNWLFWWPATLLARYISMRICASLAPRQPPKSLRHPVKNNISSA
jgi:hypothetical protein